MTQCALLISITLTKHRNPLIISAAAEQWPHVTACGSPCTHFHYKKYLDLLFTLTSLRNISQSFTIIGHFWQIKNVHLTPIYILPVILPSIFKSYVALLELLVKNLLCWLYALKMHIVAVLRMTSKKLSSIMVSEDLLSDHKGHGSFTAFQLLSWLILSQPILQFARVNNWY